jgi:hypothetical protein
MNRNREFDPQEKPRDLTAITEEIRTLAHKERDNCLALLHLLRTIEQLHRDIRDSLFLEALPDNRQALYALLRDIEASGGWPYIERMKVSSIIRHLIPETSEDSPTPPALSSDNYTLESESEG